MALLPLVLAACFSTTPSPALRQLAQLPGWSDDAAFDAFPALSASCGVIATLSAERPAALGGAPTEWRAACAAIDSLKAAFVTDHHAALRDVLEANFVALDPGGATEALVTGYYEPILDGSRVKDAQHAYPLYRLPATPTRFDRAEIDAGALAGRGLELLWVSDPVDAFFLQVQGSGRVRLPDDTIVRVGFAGTNERGYVSIGRAMVDAGIMTKEEVTLQTIRAYLAAHPDEVMDWLHKNPRYVFFRELGPSAESGPIGALNVPLVPGRSVAIDPDFVSLGLPLWLNTTRPDTGGALQRLVVAQDKGGAIKGPGRIDLFWGAGEEAELLAGEMKQSGVYWVIVPRQVGQRWLAQQAGS
ncbi:MAG: MltA domain-containing protein [Rhodospirillaceae bacterium]|nr:MltA domain-containing protein [Rhodospirillaceae bacterium]